MSTLRLWWRRAAAWASAPTGPANALTQSPPDTDALSLRDWADLPTHHPLCTHTPC